MTVNCSVGPRYQRPAIPSPDVYRGLSPGVDPTVVNSIGDEKWWALFDDPQLQTLIRTALTNNYDVRIAAARVLQAEAVVGIRRSDQLPSIYARGAGATLSIPDSIRDLGTRSTLGTVDVSLFWELDFWGKYRKATEAARAELLSTVWGQRAVLSSVVSTVATAYFELRELDLEMEIAQSALQLRQESLRLVQVRASGGVTSALDVWQSEQLVYAAARAIPDLERRIEQQENRISILVGANPGAINRGRPLVENAVIPVVPAGLPSRLLERRPDIQAAEQHLIAANARIGVARAAYFPQIGLTAMGGYQSSALTSLFAGLSSAGFAALGGQITQPIFAGGRIRSGVRLTEARRQEALFSYQQTIQQAFQEVSDSLVAYRTTQEYRKAQESLTRAAENARRLSDSRYRGGVTSYLEVLDSDSRYFVAQLTLAQAVLDERLALVQLYRALGGGWEQ
ncbi:MAG: efflux transporter outer membrane subunit [Candidatus Korobacteraceae bacterium]